MSWLSGCYTRWYDQPCSVYILECVRALHLHYYMFAVCTDQLVKLCLHKRDVYIVSYADDILLLVPSVCE